MLCCGVVPKSNMISVKVATAIGLAAIIGAGIFVLSGTAIALAGSYALVAFVFVGILASIIAMEFGELLSACPKVKGAAYSYTYEAFGSELGFITGVLMYFSFATSISVISLGFGAYFTNMLGVSSIYSKPLAVVLIFVLALVNLFGFKKAAKADFGLVALKLGILAVFILAAIALAFGSHSFNASNFSSPVSKGTVAAIFAASIAVFFAYSGFQSISTVTQRISGGVRSAARAIIYSVVVSMAFYILIVVALMVMAPASSYRISGDPLAFAMQYAHAPYWLMLLVDIGALIATASATIAIILSSSRIVYQMSSDHLLPKVLRRYNKKSDAAVNGIILSSIIGVLLLFAGNIYTIAAISNFGLIFSYIMASFAVIHFRRMRRKAEFTVPFYPYLPIIAILLLFVFLVELPALSLEIGVTMVITLLIIYYFFREYRSKKVVRIKLFE